MDGAYRLGVGQAHGKIILAGEHAVVHHQPAIALPFSSVKLTVRIKAFTADDPRSPSQVTIHSDYDQGDFFAHSDHLAGIQTIWSAFFDEYQLVRPSAIIQIKSTIPPERGMGSSAALATAFTRALFDCYQINLDSETLSDYTHRSEQIAHGNPSGIDEQIVRSRDAIYFKKDEMPAYFQLSLPAYLVVADTGEIGNTHRAVSDVHLLLKEKTTIVKGWITAIGEIVEEMMRAIKQKDITLIGKLMNKNYYYLQQLTVNNEKLDFLVQNALSAGALGAKLTGGGRGGCMIALAESERIAKKVAKHLKTAGAKETWLLSLE